MFLIVIHIPYVLCQPYPKAGRSVLTTVFLFVRSGLARSPNEGLTVKNSSAKIIICHQIAKLYPIFSTKNLLLIKVYKIRGGPT